ncbi:adenosylcobinamide-GDP ribazoletransferase [Thermoanaerobacterium sp. DL9XJH110]|uniref:adenosylcobinamide-GDP ribazoletransferase n=1 Tax=Thermoanaerobacterium sp. DL9XJH110 TaxID=3386643 RepID=UPI003BB5D2E5
MGLYVAMLFLTRIPLPQVAFDERKMGSSIAFFPLVGAFIGGILTIVYTVGHKFLSGQVISVLIVTAATIITGGMHIDGFADTMDGLFCGGDREKKLLAMKDSRIGTYGALGIALLILLKYSLINSLSKEFVRSALITYPVISRWIMTMAIVFFPYARDKGLGKVFFSYKSPRHFIVSSAIGLTAVFLVAGVYGLMAALAVFVSAFFFIVYTVRQLGGMTGDTYGAINEVSEVVALFIYAILSFKRG